MRLPPVDISRAEAIPGWMSRHELRWLMRTAQAADVAIEVGCWQGRATRAIGEAVRQTLISIDPWSDDPLETGTYARFLHAHAQTWDGLYETWRRHVADLLEAGKVAVLRLPALEAVDTLTRQGVQADFIFLDGDHRYEAVRAEIAAFQPLLRPGGILAGHDYTHPSWPGVKRAVDACFPDVQTAHSIWWVRR